MPTSAEADAAAIHPDGYEMLVRGLQAEGVPSKDVQRMMADNLAKLLDLDGTN